MEHAKRGRISKIDLLPEEAWPHVKEALTQLGQRKRTSESIRAELNSHLLAIGCEPISKSGFNRKSLQLAKIGADISMAREMAVVFAEKVDEMPEGDVGMLINEMVKVITYNLTAQIAAEDIEVAAKMLKDISLTIHRLEQAGEISRKRRTAIKESADAKAVAVVESIGKEKGLSASVVEDIKAKILGIKNE